jgi:hypothetical protein
MERFLKDFLAGHASPITVRSVQFLYIVPFTVSPILSGSSQGPDDSQELDL